jgi:hypothetical protein
MSMSQSASGTASRRSYLLGLAITVVTTAFLFLAIGALGIIGEGGRADRLYLAVFATLAVGTVLARLRPRGMALALAATAIVQVLVAVVALATGQHDNPGASALEILGLTAMYAGLFAVAAWCFWRSRDDVTSPGSS